MTVDRPLTADGVRVLRDALMPAVSEAEFCDRVTAER